MPRKLRWTRAEVNFLVDNYKEYSATQLAFILTEKFGHQRTKKSVVRKLEELRKKGVTEPLNSDIVKQRKNDMKKIEEHIGIFNDDYDVPDYVYEEV